MQTETWFTIRLKGEMDAAHNVDVTGQVLARHVDSMLQAYPAPGFAICQPADVMEAETEAEIYESEAAPVPAPPNDRGCFSYLEMEAAMCVWECLNDWTLDDNSKDDEWIALRESVGSVELRHQCIELAQWCLQVYDICTSDNPDRFEGFAYDWEVIPSILRHARDKDGPAIYAHALPEPGVVAVMINHEFAMQGWLISARIHARELYAYEPLVAEHIHSAEIAFKEGEDPEKWVRFIGQKYDLTPAE